MGEPDRASRSETYRGVEIDVHAYREGVGVVGRWLRGRRGLAAWLVTYAS